VTRVPRNIISKIDNIVRDEQNNTDYISAVIQPNTPKKAIGNNLDQSISLPHLHYNPDDSTLYRQLNYSGSKIAQELLRETAHVPIHP